MREGYSVRQLMDQSGHGRSRLGRIISEWLARPPSRPLLSPTRRLLVDGTFLERNVGIVACMDGQRREIIDGAYGVKEGSSTMRTFLDTLKERGLHPESATIDGNPSVRRHLEAVWPGIVIQRCLVHVQRQGLMWCRADPKRLDARKLRTIFLAVTAIRSPEERNRFLATFAAWDLRYGEAIEERGERGWVASDLRRARSMLRKALPDLFRYLDDPTIPKSTNSIESYFSRLKRLYRSHRGLAESRRAMYFRWHFLLNRR